jgi:hypothetical protein
MSAYIDVSDRTDQVDLAGKTLPLVSRLSCEGLAGRRYPAMALSIARAAPLVLWCPRCEDDSGSKSSTPKIEKRAYRERYYQNHDNDPLSRPVGETDGSRRCLSR